MTLFKVIVVAFKENLNIRQFAIKLLYFGGLAYGSAAFGIPDFGIDSKFGREHFPFSVDRKAHHYTPFPLLVQLSSPDVEENVEGVLFHLKSFFISNAGFSVQH